MICMWFMQYFLNAFVLRACVRYSLAVELKQIEQMIFQLLMSLLTVSVVSFVLLAVDAKVSKTKTFIQSCDALFL